MFLPSDPQNLFEGELLSEYLERKHAKLVSDIQGSNPDWFLKRDVDDYINELVTKHSVDCLSVRFDARTTDWKEVDIDLRTRPNDYDVSRNRSTPLYKKGTAIEVFVPFSGDPKLLTSKPRNGYTTQPAARIDDDELVLRYEILEHNHEELQQGIARDQRLIEGYLENVNQEVRSYNKRLAEVSRTIIEERRQRLLNDRGLAESLNIPLRRRSDASVTRLMPLNRRKVPSPQPASSNKPFEPEWTIGMEDYEFIIDVVNRTSEIMERAPSAFAGHGEEAIRFFFLAVLNSHFDGGAHGEVFNFKGKTDILITHEQRTAFIAECKIWSGPKKLTETVDQLLGYTTWRDTKTAILIFNKGRNLTNLLRQIPGLVEGHKQFRRHLPYESETGFRFVFGHGDDMDRTIIVTVLVFEIPTPMTATTPQS